MIKDLISYLKKNPIFIVLLICFFLYFTWIWSPLGLFHSWNEAYYMERISNINNGGSYYDGIFDNPPGFVYSLTIFSKIFGLNLILFRFIIILSTLFTTFFIYKIVKIISDEKTGIYSSALYGFFPMNMLFSKILQIDMFAILFMTLSIYLLLLGLKNNDKWFYISAFLLGFTVLIKIPLGLIIIPIIIYFFIGKIDFKKIFLYGLFSIIIPFSWFLHVLISSPEFLNKKATSSSNYFGLGRMHIAAPFYQLSMIALAVIFLSLLIFLYIKKRPFSNEGKLFIFSSIIFSAFFVILPNHEYYLLPVFGPLFIYIGVIFSKKNKDLLRKFILLFLIISIALIIAKPFYDVNWNEPSVYIENNFNESYIVYSSNPVAVEYYLKRDINRLHPDYEEDILYNKSIVIFTAYDLKNLEGIGLKDIIFDNLSLEKSFENKVFIYINKNI